MLSPAAGDQGALAFTWPYHATRGCAREPVWAGLPASNRDGSSKAGPTWMVRVQRSRSC